MIDATNSDNIIIGMEVIYPVACHLEMGRVKTFSAWSGVTEYIIIQPYIGTQTIKRLPEDVTLIDPRPKKRWYNFFKF